VGNFSLSLTRETIKLEAGFTLIELVASISLLVIVTFTVLSVYKYCMSTYETCYEKISSQQNARQALIMLSTAIRQADSVNVVSPYKIELRTFEGENIQYYFEKNALTGKGTLYREKNKGKNPVAELEAVNFRLADNGKTVQVELIFGPQDNKICTKTKVMPSGYLYR
jgi:type II secretory pathway component PulJ